MSFRRVGEILPQALQGLGIADRVRQEQAAHAWVAAGRELGLDLAERSRVVRLAAGELCVAVFQPRLIQAIQQRQCELVDALNRRLGEGAIERVVSVE